MNKGASMHFRDAGRGSTRSVALQRWGALIGGGALAIYGITRRSRLGVAIAASGGALAYVGATSDTIQQEAVARTSVLVNCSQQEAYRFWRDFENLPLFMLHIESVTKIGDRLYRWVAVGPLGSRISWDAEIVRERENEFISWHSLPGSDVEVNGSVEFRQAPARRGTLIDVTIHYVPPTGGVGVAVAKLLGRNPNFLIRQDLRRCKALIEAGEIPTIEGQTHGPRDTLTAAARVVDPNRPIRGDAELKDVLEARRRVA
jgi:uncharacterized membrane protein